MQQSWHDDTPEEDGGPILQARQFFGFGPGDDVDLILLRSRKFARDRKATTDAEREEINRHYQVLGGKLDRKSALPPPPLPAKPKQRPPEQDAAPAEPKAPPLVSHWDELAPGELSPDERERRRRLGEQITSLDKLVDRLRNAPVIDGTVGLMRQIEGRVVAINQLLRNDPRFLTNEQREQVLELMSHLGTRSIVGSIYWSEYPSVIAPLIDAKRQIYQALRAEVPPGHEHLTRPSNAHGYIQ